MKFCYYLSFCLLCCAMILGGASLNAQNKKFGKPSQLDWSLQVWGEVPDAEAIVICKTVDVEYKLAGDFQLYSNVNQQLSMDNIAQSGLNRYISEGNTTMTYDVKMRIKVLKDSGAGYADVDIVYFNDAKDIELYDDFYSFSVVRFEQVNGKVKKYRLTDSDWQDERLNDYYMVRHVRVPGAKAGDIVEYQYKLFSRRVTFLYDWQMQEHDIPVLYSECKMEIPYFLQFNMNVPVHPFVKSNVEEGLIFVSQQAGDMQAPKHCKSNVYHIEGRDMLPQRLDLLRQNAEGGEARLQGQGELHQLRAIENLPHVMKPVPLPEGKRHIMLKP